MKDPFAPSPGAEPVKVDPRRALIKGAVVVAGVVALAMARPGLAGTIGVMAAIVLMIMLHELGHFVMAKRAGMKVTEFFLGFGPKLWSFQRGETEYGVKAIPAGGYVRIIGMNNLEEVDPADEERTYRAKPYRHRLGVAVAGSAMHFIIAGFLLFLVFAAVGLPAGARPVISAISDGYPAAESELAEGDRIVAVNGTEVDEWQDVPDYVEAHGESELVFTVERDGKRMDVALTPELRDEGGQQVPKVGIQPELYRETEPILTAVRKTATEMPEFMWTTVKALGGIFSPSGLSNYGELLSGDGGDDNGRLLSPLGATRFAGDAVAKGWFDVLTFLFSINIFVGIFNMVPLLPLDGGHVAIATYEKIASTIKGRRVVADVSKLLPITMAVVALLAVIGISALYLDIVDPVQVP